MNRQSTMLYWLRKTIHAIVKFINKYCLKERIWKVGEEPEVYKQMKVKLKFAHWRNWFSLKNWRAKRFVEKFLNRPEIERIIPELIDKALVHEIKFGKKMTEKQIITMIEKYLREKADKI